MLRAVLDVNVLVSALLAVSGTPASLLRSWRDGAFELVVSPLLLAELERVLRYPKIARYVPAAEATAFVSALARNAAVVEDDISGSIHTAEPDDDYLVNLAANQRAVLVSGDSHVLALAANLPIRTPAEFADMVRD